MATVNFKSKAHGNILMLQSEVEKIFSMCGRTFKQQDAIDYTQLPQLIIQLEAAIDAEQAAQRCTNTPGNSASCDKEQENNLDEKDHDSHQPNIYLKQKLFPLLQMMRASYEAQTSIYWGF